VLGSGQFIPGFEEQLIGKSAGYEGDINVTFPAEYGAEHLAGKEAVFEVKLKEIRTAAEAKIDDTLATNLGLENLEALQQIMRDRIAEEYGQVARTRLKRTVLDLLADRHDFGVPEGMVEEEYGQIVRQAKAEDGQADDSQAEEAHDHDHDHDACEPWQRNFCQSSQRP
jgi:trigger factor